MGNGKSGVEILSNVGGLLFVVYGLVNVIMTKIQFNIAVGSFIP